MLRLFTLVALLFSQATLAAVSNWETFEIHNNHIVLPVEINGVASKVMLDTGANLHGVSGRFVSAHGSSLNPGKKIDVKGVLGNAKRRSFNSVELGLWGAKFKLDKVVEVNLGEGVDFLLGTAFFQQFVFQFDFPNQKLRLITRDALDLRKLKNVKSRVGNGMVSVKANLNGEKDLWLFLDTGAAGGVTTKRLYAEEYDWLETFDVRQEVSSGANRASTMDVFDLPYVEVGPHVVENVRTAVPQEGGSTTFGRDKGIAKGTHFRERDSSGILGYQVLKHFVLTVDYKKGYVHLDLPG